ncbi:MAG: ABC transporter transmembrane domain-containing protein [Deltaproteobacteria bacterium]|nr:ABC transporter transmembrane domain-containing protein [Deltaproteobacteria bacterium]
MKEDLRLYLRLLRYVKPYWPRVVLALIAMLSVSGLTALLAFLVKPVLDDVFFAKNLRMLYVLAPLVIILYVAQGVLSFVHQYQMNYAGLHAVSRIREQLFDHLQRQPLAFFDEQATGVLMGRVLYDVMVLQESIARVVTSLLGDSFTLVALTAVIFYRQWQLALMAVAFIPLVAFFTMRYGRRLRALSGEGQKTMSRLGTLLYENFTGQRIVKAFVREDFEQDRFFQASQEYMRLRLKLLIIRGLSSPMAQALGALGLAGVIIYGGYQVIQGDFTPGTFFSFLAALLLLYGPVKGISNAQNAIQEGLAAAQRVFYFLDINPQSAEPSQARILPPLSREIVYQGVSFTYGDATVLENINLVIRKGELVALVGPSGAGKTTLLNLLPRFYEVTQGAILIDGQDITEVTPTSLRDQIGLVTQQTILFHDTVRFNVAYGRLGASEAEILEALKTAHAYDFVCALPQGLDTVIGDQGVRLSGGERQRLAIARAILKNPPILLLDEATSSLDSESEQEVQQALDRLIQGRSTLVIAHRLSTVRNANRLVVMDAGRIVETGTHEELFRQGGLYRRLYELQFAAETAAG